MTAFARAAPSTSKAFQNPQQKNYMMDNLFLASTIDNEDILVAIMQSLSEIVRVSYDYMFEYIERIGGLTMKLISSEHT
jgi:hypothetical protein